MLTCSISPKHLLRDAMETPRRIAAIVLTYRPDLGVLREAVGSLCPQVDRILIVDNGTPWDAGALVDALPAADRDRLEFIWLEANIGVGAGHNRGIQWARSRGYSHVLILDHDSVPRFDMVERLCAALEQLAAEGIRVAAVGPRYKDRFTGHVSDFVRLGPWKLTRVCCDPGRTGQLLEADFIISSGALIPMPALEAVGEMNEGFFIDHVDTEWIFRAQALGYHSFGVCDALMDHSLGISTYTFWLGHWRNVPMHSPERHYYVFRNGILLSKMPHAQRRWIRDDVVRLVFMAIFFTLLAPHRWRRIRLMARGILDGLRGVTGPLR
jgi:rhamnosyltransferase